MCFDCNTIASMWLPAIAVFHSDGQNNSAKPYGYSAYVARRASVPQLWYMHNDCTITFKLGLAAIRSLYRFDRLPPALHGVKQFDNCISAWPYGQAHAFYPFWPAHRPHCAARQYASTIAIDVQHMPHHDCFQINLRSAIAVCPQRLHHCASAWPCGQALSLSFGLAAKLSLYSSAVENGQGARTVQERKIPRAVQERAPRTRNPMRTLILKRYRTLQLQFSNLFSFS